MRHAACGVRVRAARLVRRARRVRVGHCGEHRVGGATARAAVGIGRGGGGGGGGGARTQRGGCVGEAEGEGELRRAGVVAVRAAGRRGHREG